MKTAKFFALGLLLASPLALARIQLSTHIHIDSTLNENTQIPESMQTITLDVNKPTVMYTTNDLHIQAELLKEEQDAAHIRYTISAIKNADGELEIISAPEVRAEYDAESDITIAQFEEQANTDIISFVMAVKATKIE